MPLTAEQAQRLIVLRIGDIDPETGDPTRSTYGVAAMGVALLWDAYADKALIASRLQELYVQRDAIEMVLGVLAVRSDITTDTQTLKRSQVWDHYQKKLDATVGELVKVQTLALGQRRPAVGQITTVEPVSPPGGLISANDPRYTGSPYSPSRSGR